MLEMTTENALGTGWVDNVPGSVITGYQAQNVSAEAVRAGLDTIIIKYGGSLVGLYAEAGGTVDENGILYTLKANQSIALPTISTGALTLYFALKDEAGTDKSIEMITGSTYALGAYSVAKNGYYTADNRRVLNTAVILYNTLVTNDKSYTVFAIDHRPEYPKTRGARLNDPDELVTFRTLDFTHMLSPGAREYDFTTAIGANVPTVGGISMKGATAVLIPANGGFLTLTPSATPTASFSSRNRTPDSVAYLPLYDGGEGYALSKNSERKIYLYKSLNTEHAVIDLSAAIGAMTDIKYTNGTMYVCTGTEILQLTGFTSNIANRWRIESGGTYFAKISFANDFVYSVSQVGGYDVFNNSIHVTARSSGNVMIPMNYARLSHVQLDNVEYYSGMLLSFNVNTKKLYVQ